MIPFIIGEEQKQELALLKQNAESNPFNADAMRKRINGTWEPGDHVSYTCYIPIDFKVVFTIEAALEARNPEHSIGMIRHLSVSIQGRQRVPAPHAVQLIMNELGFVNTLESGKCQVWSEKEGVMNIIEFIENKE